MYGYYQVSWTCYLGSIPNFENFYKYIKEHLDGYLDIYYIKDVINNENLKWIVFMNFKSP